MIWFFDSWFWWLQTMKYFYELYPEYDYVFLADNKNYPFWNKSREEIQKITFDALNRFFDNWAEIVIVACNTAAAYSIRKWQTLYPNKKTLSITIPGIEEILSSENNWMSFGIIATQATISSDIYNDLYYRFGGTGTPDFHFVMAPKLIDMVEFWSNQEYILSKIKEYLWQFPEDIKALILWCTHFSVYKRYFSELFDWKIIDPSLNSAFKFNDYLINHPEIKNKLSKNWILKFYTTWDTKSFDKIWSQIRWKNINSQNIVI